MLGGIVKGIGSGVGSAVKGIAGAAADTAGLTDFTSALGMGGMGADESTDKPKAAKVKAFDEDESPTKILQRILTEVQTIHKVMASQVVPESEKKEEEMDKDKKDDEVIKALEDLRPEEEKEKEDKDPWWKRLLGMIAPFFLWILNPLNWLKFLPTIPGFAKFALFAKILGRFFLFTPIGRVIALVAIVALNWQSIRKTISNSVISIRNTIKEILEAVFMSGVLPDDWDEGTEEVRLWGRTKEEREAEEAAEKEDIRADTEGEEGKDWWIDEQGRMNIMIRKGADDLSEVDDERDAQEVASDVDKEEARIQKILFGGDAPLSEEAFQQHADFPGDISEYQDYRMEWDMEYKARGQESGTERTIQGAIPGQGEPGTIISEVPTNDTSLPFEPLRKRDVAADETMRQLVEKDVKGSKMIAERKALMYVRGGYGHQSEHLTTLMEGTSGWKWRGAYEAGGGGAPDAPDSETSKAKLLKTEMNKAAFPMDRAPSSSAGTREMQGVPDVTEKDTRDTTTKSQSMGTYTYIDTRGGKLEVEEGVTGTPAADAVAEKFAGQFLGGAGAIIHDKKFAGKFAGGGKAPSKSQFLAGEVPEKVDGQLVTTPTLFQAPDDRPATIQRLPRESNPLLDGTKPINIGKDTGWTTSSPEWKALEVWDQISLAAGNRQLAEWIVATEERAREGFGGSSEWWLQKAGGNSDLAKWIVARESGQKLDQKWLLDDAKGNPDLGDWIIAKGLWKMNHHQMMTPEELEERKEKVVPFPGHTIFGSFGLMLPKEMSLKLERSVMQSEIMGMMSSSDDTTVQKAAQVSSLTTITHSGSTNVYSENSTSKQANVGSNQQSFDGSNPYGAAPSW